MRPPGQAPALAELRKGSEQTNQHDHRLDIPASTMGQADQLGHQLINQAAGHSLSIERIFAVCQIPLQTVLDLSQKHYVPPKCPLSLSTALAARPTPTVFA